MKTVTIRGRKYKNEKFTIGEKYDMSDLPALVKKLVENGYEKTFVWLDRVVTGRKKPYSVLCMQVAGQNTFISHM